MEQQRNNGGDFDFPNSTPPVLYPLTYSHKVGQVEAQLKDLVQHLWAKHLALDVFDVSVIGAAHLGSFEQVRRMVNQDGLALIPNTVVEPRTRYLYRAWKSQNHQGRGLHFLNTYLQMLFPNMARAEQLWMNLDGNYPEDAFPITPIDDYFFPLIQSATILKVDGRWNLGEMVNVNDVTDGDPESEVVTEGLFLTSRVRITLDFGVEMEGIGNLLQIFRAVMPARLVPVFHYVVSIDAPQAVVGELWIDAEIPLDITAYTTDLIITEGEKGRWYVGSDNDIKNAPILSQDRVQAWIETRVGAWPDVEFDFDLDVQRAAIETALEGRLEGFEAQAQEVEFIDAKLEPPHMMLADIYVPSVNSDGFAFDGQVNIDALPEITPAGALTVSFGFDAQPLDYESILFWPDEIYVLADPVIEVEGGLDTDLLVQTPQVGIDAAYSFATEAGIEWAVAMQAHFNTDAHQDIEHYAEYESLIVTDDVSDLWYVGSDSDIGRAHRMHEIRVQVWDSDQE